MNEDQVALLIDAAVDRGYISSAQAGLLREEMFMFPGVNVVSIMTRRGMISPDQARELESGPSEKVADNADDTDVDFSFIVPSKPNEQAPGPETTSSTQPPLSIPPTRQPDTPIDTGRPRSFVGHDPIARTQRSDSSSQNLRPVFTQNTPAVSRRTGSTTSGLTPDADLIRLFNIGRERGCSDLHLSVGKPPYFRQEGKIFFFDEPPLTADSTDKLNRSVLTPEQRAELDENLQLDFSFECQGAGRFRANVYQQRLGLEGAYRFIPEEVPTLESLQLPKVLEKLTTYPQGLNLVTGPGGCGKTSTVAAMLEYINCHRHEHIITVEDPVEYVLRPNSCQVTQREVGTHTGSFAGALRTALRQDPDVIMIGELRDLETTSISITAAETGHLVFGTLHTSSAARTVARILDVYPPAQRAQICMMVAESLRGIISQQLIERKDGRGRVCAMEILLITTGVSQVIKEGKTHQLISHMQSGRKQGMISMDDSLMELLQAGMISGQNAYARAENKGSFELLRNV